MSEAIRLGLHHNEQTICLEVSMAGSAAKKGSDPTVAMFARARRYLARQDAVLKALMSRVGPCTLRPGGDAFYSLVRAVVAQVISTAAARTVQARLEAALGGITPALVLAAGEERLRSVGLSQAKASSLLDLAERVVAGEVPLDRYVTTASDSPTEADDEEMITRLVQVRGIGRWTAEMFLIFCLGRLDVLPVDDLGLRAGVRDHYGLEALPGKAELRALAEPWKPYRSVATWYLWRSRGFVPQSATK
jgi:DNA-3-methyladenine glycosylase II